MSDEGEKSCPLCAEEMDLTDQQLKPCKCGYEICIWCWHHIMDMAEKDATEGRCPACRTPYNKEKVVGTAAKCERLVSEMNVEKKFKSQKGKGKTSEGRKQLESVRVIQRNLVYVVGLPLDFADEDLLQRKEYFAQYGKVLKVSISRTTTGAIQQFANSTCSVYITYSNEEEAVRCIQSVHGFALDGRSLKACFGTTKYCHAWLRNVPCTNQDCLYLHETGSQEDSFTKDEIVSAYTRNRVQYITSSSNSMQCRSGNVLPPPADEYCNSSSASTVKPTAKAAINTNNSTISARVSPPNSSSGKSAALPAGASWATRPSSNTHQTLPTSNPQINPPSNQKPGMSNGPVVIPKTSSSTSQVPSLHGDTGKRKVLHNEESLITREKTKTETSNSKEKESNIDGNVSISTNSVASAHVASFPSSRQPHSPSTTSPQPDSCDLVDSSIFSSGVKSEKKSLINHRDANVENVSSSVSSLTIHDKHVRNGCVELITKAANSTDDVCASSVQSDCGLGMQTKLTQVDWRDREDDVLSFDNQRINDPEIATSRVPEFSHVLNLSNISNIHSHELNNSDGSLCIGFDRHVVDRNNGKLMAQTSNFPSGYPENVPNNFKSGGAGNFNLFPSKERPVLGRYEGEAASGALDMRENSMISSILSMDFNPWGEESLTSPQNMSKFLGDTDKRQGSYGAPGPQKIHNSNQSRFSFAREGETIGHVSSSGQSTDYYEQPFKQRSFDYDISRSNGFSHDRSFSHNGLSVFSGTGPDSFAGSHSHISSNKHSASRSHISAPPGFSVPSRAAPPPGFSSHERTDPIFEPLSGNHMLDASSSLLRNQYQTHPMSNNTFSNGDIEFIDPAILAVGKGTLPGGINNNNHPSLDMMSSFPPQLSSYDDARFQSFLQRPIPPQQNQRFTDMGVGFSTHSGAYGIPSRIGMDQTMSNNLPPYSQFNLSQSRNGIASNGQWDGWSGSQSGNNLGFNKLYGGYEDSKIQNPSSGNNIYNRTYGI